jgi:two-component system LytT family response regulator
MIEIIEKCSKLAMHTQEGYQIIPIEKITYCIADGSYTILLLEDNKKIMVSKPLIAIEKCLENFSFIRCHNSYLVNAIKIEEFNQTKKAFIIKGETIPVSRRKYCTTIFKLKKIHQNL